MCTMEYYNNTIPILVKRKRVSNRLYTLCKCTAFIITSKLLYRMRKLLYCRFNYVLLWIIVLLLGGNRLEHRGLHQLINRYHLVLLRPYLFGLAFLHKLSLELVTHGNLVWQVDMAEMPKQPIALSQV